jgi:LPXTG-motif cell wall-anchored protein
MKRLFAAVVMAAMVLLAAPAGAQQYPPSDEEIVTDTTIVPGQTINPTAGNSDAPESATVDLAATDDGSTDGTLPRTGDDSSLPLARIGLALAAVGGVATAVAAQRRKALASAD